jgi:hypothetical protein
MKSSRKSSAKTRMLPKLWAIFIPASGKSHFFSGPFPKDWSLEAELERERFISARGQRIALEKRREKAKLAEEWFAFAHAQHPKYGAKKLADASRELFLLNKAAASAKELSLFTQHRARAFLAKVKGA